VKWAREADFGLMIWDGKSAGTILNILRLLARESLYRALGSAGNPEFNTVLKVIIATGLRLMVAQASDEHSNEKA
jgi:hypothetical protein